MRRLIDEPLDEGPQECKGCGFHFSECVCGTLAPEIDEGTERLVEMVEACGSVGGRPLSSLSFDRWQNERGRWCICQTPVYIGYGLVR